jgi:DNA-binding MarR family transcriptional regulator
VADSSKPAARPPRKPRTRAELVQATLDALRVLDLATSRFRVATAQTWQITVSDSLVMSNLAMSGGAMTPRDLGRRLLISSGTLTSMLDRLESHDLVRRVPNPHDRRSLLIELTEQGRDSLFYSGSQLRQAVDGALAARGSKQLIEVLLAVAAALDSITDDISGNSG